MTSNANTGGASAALARAGVVVPWAIGLAAFGFLSPSAPVGGLPPEVRQELERSGTWR